MAAKFSGVPKKLVSAKIWVSKMPVIKGQYPNHRNISNLSELIETYDAFGIDWTLAFYKTSSGWKKGKALDPSIFISSNTKKHSIFSE